MEKVDLDYQADITKIELKTIKHIGGSLSVVEAVRDIPIEIKRIFYIWDTLESTQRGGHAHKELVECFIAIYGECDLVFNDGASSQTFHMNDPSECLIVPPGYWLDIKNFKKDSVLLVLASDYYEEDDYIRDYGDYLKYVKERR